MIGSQVGARTALGYRRLQLRPTVDLGERVTLRRTGGGAGARQETGAARERGKNELLPQFRELREGHVHRPSCHDGVRLVLALMSRRHQSKLLWGI